MAAYGEDYRTGFPVIEIQVQFKYVCWASGKEKVATFSKATEIVERRNSEGVFRSVPRSCQEYGQRKRRL